MAANYQEIKDHTLSYFKGKLSEDDLNKSLKNLSIDSLDFLEYVMSLEEKFKMEIESDTVDTDTTLKQFCRRIGIGT